jgi:TM2 domain-containing membrane protein YozV
VRGKILTFDVRTGEGLISGADHGRYTFGGADWQAGGVPLAGANVDFGVEDGRAVAIYRTPGAGTAPGEKSRVVAALLAFFLGGLGIHKFYLGKNGAGLIMLLVSLFGIILLFLPTMIIGVIAFIEFIIYLVTSDEDFEERYIVGDRAWF